VFAQAAVQTPSCRFGIWSFIERWGNILVELIFI
jgi:hypothetical protein